MSPSHIIEGGRQKWPTRRCDTYLRESTLCNEDKVIARFVVYTRMSKRNPNVSTQHGSRLSCSAYAGNLVDLYHGLQCVCSRYVNTIIFLSVFFSYLLYGIIKQKKTYENNTS